MSSPMSILKAMFWFKFQSKIQSHHIPYWPRRAASTGSMQLGQVKLLMSQSSIHSMWYMCMQGRYRTWSPTWNSIIQITHLNKIQWLLHFTLHHSYSLFFLQPSKVPVGRCCISPILWAILIWTAKGKSKFKSTIWSLTCSSSVSWLAGLDTFGDG